MYSNWLQSFQEEYLNIILKIKDALCCSLFFLFSVIKHWQKKTLGAKKIKYFGLQVTVHHLGNPWQEITEAKPQRNVAYWLALCGLLSLLFIYVGPFAQRLYYPQRPRSPTSSINQGKYSTDMGHESDGGCPSIEVPSSQMIVVCVKLAKPNQPTNQIIYF